MGSLHASNELKNENTEMPIYKDLNIITASDAGRNKSSGRKNLPDLISIFLFLSVLILCFFETFLWLHYKYSFKDSYYSHGYLVPFVSGYLIYLKRDHLKRQTIQPKNMGLLLICISLVCHMGISNCSHPIFPTNIPRFYDTTTK